MPRIRVDRGDTVVFRPAGSRLFGHRIAGPYYVQCSIDFSVGWFNGDLKYIMRIYSDGEEHYRVINSRTNIHLSLSKEEFFAALESIR